MPIQIRRGAGPEGQDIIRGPDPKGLWLDLVTGQPIERGGGVKGLLQSVGALDETGAPYWGTALWGTGVVILGVLAAKKLGGE